MDAWGELPERGSTVKTKAMPVVSIVSLKGGVGKTAVTLGLAGAATSRGLASLVVDLDPQGNATSILRSQMCWSIQLVPKSREH